MKQQILKSRVIEQRAPGRIGSPARSSWRFARALFRPRSPSARRRISKRIEPISVPLGSKRFRT